MCVSFCTSVFAYYHIVAGSMQFIQMFKAAMVVQADAWIGCGVEGQLLILI